MDKVKLEIKKGEAVITEGANSFIGKLLAGHKLKINKQQPNRRRITGEVEIAKK